MSLRKQWHGSSGNMATSRTARPRSSLWSICWTSASRLQTPPLGSSSFLSNTSPRYLCLRCYTITAIMKLVAQCGVCPPVVQNLIRSLTNSKSLEVVQRSISHFLDLRTHLAPQIIRVPSSPQLWHHGRRAACRCLPGRHRSRSQSALP